MDKIQLVRRASYCAGPYVPLLDWLWRPFLPSQNQPSGWPQLKDRFIVGTSSGRTAVALVCRLLGIGPEHDVLVPAYNCGTELDAILYCGARTVGYRVSPRCEIDIEDIFARATHRTKAVYVIHYFGWVQPMLELRQWCDTNGILLIEDCALSLFSSGSTGAGGRTGDAAIFSLSKTFGTRRGGLISLPKAQEYDAYDLVESGSSVLLDEIWHSAKATAFRCLDSVGLYDAIHSAVRRPSHQSQNGSLDIPPMPSSYYFHPELDADRAILPRAWALLGTIPFEEIVRRRRQNYMHLAQALRGMSGMSVLYDELPEGVCPLAFPLQTAHRAQCVEILQSRGIAALPWWAGFHASAIDWSQFPDAAWLKHHVMTLPIHQSMDDIHVNYIADAVIQMQKSRP